MVEKQWDNPLAENWKNQVPPARPSPAECVVFKRFLDEKIRQKGNQTKVLILGSTPEFRDLINNAWLTAHCVDYSKENYEAFALLKKMDGVEQFYQQDWTAMRLPEKFDLIFAEAALNAISKADAQNVCKSVKEHCAPEGLFIVKNWIRMPKKSVSLPKILKTYREQFKGNFKQMTILPLYSFLYDEVENCIALKDIFLSVKRYFQEGILRREEFASFENLGYETTKHQLFFPLEEEFNDLVAPFFAIKEKIIPEPIGMNTIPVYVLSP